MKLTLTRRGDYVLRAALHLAENWQSGGYTKTRDVAAAVSLPISYTPQVLGLLARADLASARSGRDGGYRLARDPAEISILEVVEAAEGDLRSANCILRGGPCHWEVACAVHPAWARASEAFRQSLDQTTLAELAEVDRAMAEGAPERARD
jgi:Rrf2 family protein